MDNYSTFLDRNWTFYDVQFSTTALLTEYEQLEHIAKRYQHNICLDIAFTAVKMS